MDQRTADKIFFDGGCPVCRREIAWYQAMRGGDKLRWVDVTDTASAKDFPSGMSTNDLLKRFTVVRRDGAVVQGAAAFVAIWRAIDRLSSAGRLLDNGVCVWIGERGYRGFLLARRLWRRAT